MIVLECIEWSIQAWMMLAHLQFICNNKICPNIDNSTICTRIYRESNFGRQRERDIERETQRERERERERGRERERADKEREREIKQGKRKEERKNE